MTTAQYGIVIRTVPLIDGACISALGGFTILNLDGDKTAIMYHEAAMGDAIRDAQDVVERYRPSFEQMWEVALNPIESTRLIEAHVATLFASLDRAKRDG